MQESQVLDLLVQYFGTGGVIVALVWVLYRFFWRRYEERTNELIESYKEQLEEAKEQMLRAVEERREITRDFLSTLVQLLQSNGPSSIDGDKEGG